MVASNFISAFLGTFGLVDYTNNEDMKYAVSYQEKSLFASYYVLPDIFNPNSVAYMFFS